MTRGHGFGWVPDRRHPTDAWHRAGPRALPRRVDLRAALPPAWSQGPIESCTAHALAAAVWVIDGRMASRLALYWAARAARRTVGRDSGAMLRHAIAGLRRHGVVAEAAWPYRPVPGHGRHRRFARDAPPARRPPAGRTLAVAAARVAQTLPALKACLAEGHPVLLGLWVHASFRDAAGRWRRVMPRPKRGEPRLGGHAVAAVGYCDARRAFLIRNSWGPAVQERGHFWLPYALATDRRLAVDFWTLRPA